MDYKEKTQGKRTEKVQKKYIVKQFEDKMMFDMYTDWKKKVYLHLLGKNLFFLIF
jgi:hypothetical protein